MNHFSKWYKSPFYHPTLFWGFVFQEIKAKYAGSVGGLLWSIVVPLANLAIYIFVFSVIFKIRIRPVESGTDSFVLFLLTGLLPWITFNEAVSGSATLFVAKANMITKVAFPLELLPISGVLVTFILNGIGFAMLLIYLTIEGYFCVAWLILPIITMLYMVFILGIVIFVASLTVFIRDIQQMLPSLLSLWLYVTPVLYPVQMVPETLQIFVKMNPVYPFIELYHLTLLKNSISYPLLGLASGISILSFISGAIFYSRSRNAFADVL